MRKKKQGKMPRRSPGGFGRPGRAGHPPCSRGSRRGMRKTGRDAAPCPGQGARPEGGHSWVRVLVQLMVVASSAMRMPDR